jgi:hypothetical protein
MPHPDRQPRPRGAPAPAAQGTSIVLPIRTRAVGRPTNMLILLAFAFTLLLAVLVSELAERSVLSTAVLFLLSGFVLGGGMLNVIVLQPGEPVLSTFTEVALFSVLFTEGVHLGIRDLTRAWRLPGRALIVGLPITLGITAVLAHVVVGLPWPESILIGAALSPTDPVFAATLRPPGRPAPAARPAQRRERRERRARPAGGHRDAGADLRERAASVADRRRGAGRLMRFVNPRRSRRSRAAPLRRTRRGSSPDGRPLYLLVHCHLEVGRLCFPMSGTVRPSGSGSNPAACARPCRGDRPPASSLTSRRA